METEKIILIGPDYNSKKAFDSIVSHSVFQESYDTFKEIIIKQIVAQRGNRSSSLRGSSVPRRFDGRSIVSRTIFGGELKHVGTLEGVSL